MGKLNPRREPRNDEEMIRDPSNWPKWPYLPVKKYVDTPEVIITGVLLNTTLTGDLEEPITIYQVNLWGEKDLENCTKHHFDTIRAMLADAWVVD